MSEEEDLKYLQTEYEENIITELIKEVESLQNQLQQKENIRKEAIKFINEWLFEAGGNGADMDYDTIVDLLNILNKGDNNGRK